LGQRYPSHAVIEAGRPKWRQDLGELWDHRELVYFLVWRDVKVRYKQTLIGAGWALLQPLTTMVIFTFVFGRIAKIPSDGVPYPLFAYTGIIAWTYFSQSLGRAASSVVGNAHLITKVYFPRLAAPIAATVTPMVDFALSLVALAGLMVWFGVVPTWRIVVLPGFFLLAVAASLAIGLWLAPVNARYRDVGLTLPFVIQVWMYASPVVYPVSVVPAEWRFLYALNPVVSVVEGFRWALLGRGTVDPVTVAINVATVGALLWSGGVYFQRTQRTFADVV
jgi:lipopolysaccharide transport system permease protein